jgi:hypothetical protein
MGGDAVPVQALRALIMEVMVHFHTFVEGASWSPDTRKSSNSFKLIL